MKDILVTEPEPIEPQVGNDTVGSVARQHLFTYGKVRGELRKQRELWEELVPIAGDPDNPNRHAADASLTWIGETIAILKATGAEDPASNLGALALAALA